MALDTIEFSEPKKVFKDISLKIFDQFKPYYSDSICWYLKCQNDHSSGFVGADLSLVNDIVYFKFSAKVLGKEYFNGITHSNIAKIINNIEEKGRFFVYGQSEGRYK